MKATIIYNSKTKDMKLTQSKVGGFKWNKFIRNGYKPLGIVSGWNIVVIKGI